MQQVRGSARAHASNGWLVVAQDSVTAWFAAAARPAYALAAMAVVMLVGGLFSMSAASEATPGSLLYTVKLIGEKTQFAFVREPEAEMRLHAVLADRRAAELGQVAVSDASQVQTVAASLIAEVDDIKTKLNQIEREQPQRALAVAREVEAHTRQLRRQLESAKETVALNAESTTQTLDEAIESIDKTELAALRALATAQPANEEEKASVEREVGNKVANKIAQAKERAAATEEELNEQSVFSAGLARTDRNIQTSASIEAAKTKTEAANQAIAEAEALLQKNNYTEALDKLTESENLLDEATAAQNEAEEQSDAATSTPQDQPATDTPDSGAGDSTAGNEGIDIEVKGARATSTE